MYSIKHEEPQIYSREDVNVDIQYLHLSTNLEPATLQELLTF